LTLVREFYREGTILSEQVQSKREITENPFMTFPSAQIDFTNSPRCVTYIPPASTVVNQLARDTCKQLAERGSSGFDEPEVIQGLADFLNFAAELTAKLLNRKI